MPEIRPLSDLKHRLPEIAEICHDGQAVYITKNGRGDLVMLSLDEYDRQQALLEVYRKLLEAELEEARGGKSLSHEEMMAELQAIIDARK